MKKNYLSLREIQLEELEILKNVVQYINKNSLRYYLCGGTLLGAIRHKGFIPWDDDIDIFMPRDDYNKFIELYNNKDIGEEYELKTIELNNSKYPFAKVINKDIIIEGQSSEDKNLWIDIFPIDAYSNDDQEAKKQAKKINFYQKLIYLHITKFKYIIKENKNAMNKTIKVILKPLAMLIPMKYISKKMIRISQKYSYGNSEYLGVVVWGYGIRERVKRETFSKFIEVEFEKEKFKAPVGYDTYLSSIYGKYMEIPPMEKRITHSLKAKKM